MATEEAEEVASLEEQEVDDVVLPEETPQVVANDIDEKKLMPDLPAVEKVKSGKKAKESSTTPKPAKGASKDAKSNAAAEKSKSGKKSAKKTPSKPADKKIDSARTKAAKTKIQAASKIDKKASSSKLDAGKIQKEKSKDTLLEAPTSRNASLYASRSRLTFENVPVDVPEVEVKFDEELTAGLEEGTEEADETDMQGKKKKKFVMPKRFEYEFRPEHVPAATDREKRESDESSIESEKDKKIDADDYESPVTRLSLEMKPDELDKPILKKSGKKRRMMKRRLKKKSRYFADATDSDAISFKSMFSRHSVQSGTSVKPAQLVLASEQTSSESTHEDEQKAFDSLLLKSNFLKEFADLPELSDIMTSSSSALNFVIPHEEEAAEEQDSGYFVQTITSHSMGTEEESRTASISSTSRDEAIEEPDVEAEASGDDDMETDLDLKSDDIDLEKKPTEKDADEDASTALFHIGKEVIVMDDEEIEAKRRRVEEAAAFHALTVDFLYELFDDVVQTVEKKDIRAKMAASLDKKRLWNQLKSLATQYEKSTGLNRLLERKMIEHYKRNKNMRAIVPLSNQMENIEKIKYSEYLQQLDFLIEKETEMVAHQNVILTNADAEVRDAEMEKDRRENEFEDFVRSTLIQHRQFAYLPKFIDRELTKMATKRAEVSELRVKVLHRQHAMARLHAKMDELENFSDSLTMSGFMHMQTEVQSLGKKIEERNTELNRLRATCNANLHVLTHMREKQELLTKNLQAKTEELNLLQKQRKAVRHQLFSEKLLRSNLRQEGLDVSQQGGLLDKPNLMFDYDATTEKVEALEAEVLKLKAELAELMRKISTFT